MTTPGTLEQRYVAACEAGNLALRCRLEGELEQAKLDTDDRLAQPGALLRAALWYAKQGIAVFPCQSRGKTPLTAHGFKSASIDPDQISAWWSATPTANIGAPTGVTFDVIDVDGPDGVGSIYFRTAEKGDALKTARLSMPPKIGHSLTSRIAGHHIFIAPTGRGNKAGFMPGVDYRGKGGYVILPPSIGANGRRYQWTKPLQAGTP